MHKFSEELKELMEQNGELIAYTHNDKTYTYKEILGFAKELAKILQKEGTSPVILYGHKSVRMLIMMVACLLAGRAYVPVDVYMPIERIKKIIEQTKTSLVINNSECELNEIKSFAIEELFEEYNDKEHNYCFAENNIAYIIFTSGSTGNPKGVPISYDNLYNFTKWIKDLIPCNSYEKQNVLNQASFSFDLSVADLYYSLFGGHNLVALENRDADSYSEIFDVIKNKKINVIVATPTFMKLLLLQKDFVASEYENLKTIYLCGETLEKRVAEKILNRFPDITLINAYGPTEATSAVSGIVINEKMLDEEYLPVGEISTAATDIIIKNNEILLGGKSVFDGYLDAKNDEIFYSEDDKRYYKTGDLGEIKGDLLYCYGRLDSQIKYKGYRIELNDIEKNLKSLLEVEDAIVVAKRMDDKKTVKLIKAYVILKKEIDVSEIKSRLGEKMPSYMIPGLITIVEEFPVNNNGKIDRKKLSEI